MSADKGVKSVWYQIGIAALQWAGMLMASYFKSKWWASFTWATMPSQVSSTRKHLPHIRPRCQCAQMWLFADSWLPTDNVQKGQMVFVSMLDFWCHWTASLVWSLSSPNITWLLVSPVRAYKGFPLLSTNTLATFLTKDRSTIPFKSPATSIVRQYWHSSSCTIAFLRFVFKQRDISLSGDLTVCHNMARAPSMD